MDCPIHSDLNVVCYTAIFSVVTQRNPAVCGEARRVTTLKTAV